MRYSARIEAFKGMRENRRQERQKGRVTLAGCHPKANTTRALGKGARKTLVSDLVDRMAHWEESAFEHEGAVVAGLRSQLCLDGNRWSLSDRDARDVVEEAFRDLGLSRPTWDQGQREFTAYDGGCIWCHGEIAEEMRVAGRDTRFCSTECARSASFHHAEEWSQRSSSTARAAGRILKRETLPTVECRQCAKPFQPFALKRERWNFCSRACYAESRRYLAEVKCAGCGESFRPKNRFSKFCTKECSNATMAHRRPRAERECAWCGTAFFGDISKRYCDRACSGAASNFHRGLLRSVTPAAFDYMLRCDGVRFTDECREAA